jgi:hypothetical protein
MSTDETPTATPNESPCPSPTGLRYRGIQHELVTSEAVKSLPCSSRLQGPLARILEHSRKMTYALYSATMVR